MLRRFRRAHAHEQSLYFVNTSFYRTDRSKRLLRAIRELDRRCLFRLHSLKLIAELYKTKKKALENSLKIDGSAAMLMVKRLVPFLLNKHFKFSESKNGT